MQTRYFITDLDGNKTEIDQTLFAKLKANSSDLVRLVHAEMRESIVRKAFKSLEMTQFELSLDNQIDPPLAFDNIRDITEIYHHSLLNFLTASSMYIDQLNKDYRDIFQCEKENPLTKFISTIYDTSDAYLIFYTLRNTIQHRELPIKRATLTSDWAGDGLDGTSKLIRYSFEPGLIASEIYRGKASPTAQRRLEAMGDVELDLKRLSRHYYCHLTEIHCEFQRLSESKAIDIRIERDKAITLLTKEEETTSTKVYMAIAQSDHSIDTVHLSQEVYDQIPNKRRGKLVANGVKNGYICSASTKEAPIRPFSAH